MARDARRTTPTGIRKQGSVRLRVTWADGHASEYSSFLLRSRCPCAHCVDEMTGERRVGPLQIVPQVGMQKATMVGNYAIQIDWSDGHRTGLYSFDYLRGICPCEDCAESAAAH